MCGLTHAVSTSGAAQSCQKPLIPCGSGIGNQKSAMRIWGTFQVKGSFLALRTTVSSSGAVGLREVGHYRS
jgi:hypothetical protein